jgi:glycosyltransferase involved in cell wall biosynthesis
MNLSDLKIAIIHDWLVTSGGAERVLEQIISCFPNAHLYVIIDFLSKEHRQFIKDKTIKTSFIQHLPFANKMYWYYCPLMPLAVEQFDLSDYDIIISSSYAVAKGIIAGPDQLHISYIHSPIRFAWDLKNYYLKVFNYERGIKSLLARLLFHYLRLWDSSSVNSIDSIITNSHFTNRRILKAYRRNATVIYPPVNTDIFTFYEEKEDFYLVASFMNPFKKIDLVVAAFTKMPNRKLIVIGDGPEFQKIQSKATSNISFLGYVTVEKLRDYMQRAKAFIFAAPEDFGIIMVEAQACGTPVIAYGKGGAVEIVRDLNHLCPTGVLFTRQTVDCLVQAIEKFEIEQHHITFEDCRQNALRFAPEYFREELKMFVKQKWSEFGSAKILTSID